MQCIVGRPQVQVPVGFLFLLSWPMEHVSVQAAGLRKGAGTENMVCVRREGPACCPSSLMVSCLLDQAC